MPETQKPDLELVSTKDLVDEIFRRHAYGIVCAGRAEMSGPGNEWLLRWSGPVHACIGAAAHMVTSLTKALVDASKNVTGDEVGQEKAPPT